MLSLYEHAPGIVSHFHGANHRSSSWEELVSEIAGVDGFQEFLAGDLSCDMLDSPVFNGGMPVSRTFHDLNDWVYIGPGCRIGTPAGEVSPSFGEMLSRYVCVCVQDRVQIGGDIRGSRNGDAQVSWKAFPRASAKLPV